MDLWCVGNESYEFMYLMLIGRVCKVGKVGWVFHNDGTIYLK